MSDETEYSLAQGYKAFRVQPGDEGDDVVFISVESTNAPDGDNNYGVTIGIPIGDVDFVMQMLQRAASTVRMRQEQARYLEGSVQIDGPTPGQIGAAFGGLRRG